MTVVDVSGIARAMFASASSYHDRLLAWDAAIRQPVGAVRRIGFVQLEPGCGATTLAREVVRTISARRATPPLVADLSVGGDLAARIGIADASVSIGRRLIRTSAEASVFLQRTSYGALGIRPVGAATDAVRAWTDEVAPIVRFHEVAIMDFGPHDPNDDLAPVAALCDTVCVVAPDERRHAELARVIADAIAALPEKPFPVVALVDRGYSTRRVPHVIAAQTTHPVIAVPSDPGLAIGASARTLRTRQAIIELAASLVGSGSRVEREWA